MGYHIQVCLLSSDSSVVKIYDGYAPGIYRGRRHAFFLMQTERRNRTGHVEYNELSPELVFSLLELKRTKLRTNTRSTREQRQGCLPFLRFFLEKHIGSSSDAQLSPGILLKFCLVPLLKASKISFDLYLICLYFALLCQRDRKRQGYQGPLQLPAAVDLYRPGKVEGPLPAQCKRSCKYMRSITASSPASRYFAMLIPRLVLHNLFLIFSFISRTEREYALAARRLTIKIGI